MPVCCSDSACRLLQLPPPLGCCNRHIALIQPPRFPPPPPTHPAPPPGGDLYEDLKRAGGQHSERTVAGELLPPFMAALAHMHARSVVHRDIKPENILLTADRTVKARGSGGRGGEGRGGEGRGGAGRVECLIGWALLVLQRHTPPLPRPSAQVADFGLSINWGEERPVTRAGTLDYMSPEVLLCPEKSRPEENKVGADGWGVRGGWHALLLHCAGKPAGRPGQGKGCRISCLGWLHDPAAHRTPRAHLQEKVELGYSDAVDVWAAGILAYELLVSEGWGEPSCGKLEGQGSMAAKPSLGAMCR